MEKFSGWVYISGDLFCRYVQQTAAEQIAELRVCGTSNCVLEPPYPRYHSRQCVASSHSGFLPERYHAGYTSGITNGGIPELSEAVDADCFRYIGVRVFVLLSSQTRFSC